MRRGGRTIAAAVAALAAVTVAGGGAAAGERPARADSYTPVLQRVVAAPRWYVGIDGDVHVAYELLLTNSLPVEATIESIVVSRGGGAELKTLAGEELRAAISPLGSPAETGTRLPPAASAVAYIDLAVDRRAQLPRRLAHTLTVDVGPGLPLPERSTHTGARSGVHRGPAVRIDPPLSGPRWAGIVGAHRRAVQPVNGSLRNGQRFAIDWNRLDEQFRPAFGDRSSFASNPSYGAPVRAVGDAKVVRAVDGIADQPPDSFEPVGIELADGNHVILRLAPGVFAGYAHLIPGSVAVERGERVRSGERIGRLGNSGNSNGPHLHFQLMNRPSLLASEGLPFELRRFRLAGVVPSLEAFGEADANQTPVPFTTEGAGTYRDKGPVGLDILDLPGPRPRAAQPAR